MIEFSVAESVNVLIHEGAMSKACKTFLNLIYKDFQPPVATPKKIIKLRVEDISIDTSELVKLGNDGFYSDRFLSLKSGHHYASDGNVISITVPSMVKRGRVPFKRSTPGRHISDEVIEPLMVVLLQELEFSCYHASSIIEKNGEASINIAWRATGKTNAILPHIYSGRVLSDDLSFVDEKNGILYSYPRPLRLYGYNIDVLDADRLTKFKLQLKSLITPPWQPVDYIPILPSVYSTKKYNKVYMNGEYSNIEDYKKGNESLFLQITAFEFAHFDEAKAMLKICGILN